MFARRSLGYFWGKRFFCTRSRLCGSTLDLDNSLSSEQCSFPSWQSKSESLQYDVLVLHPKIRWGSESPSRLKIGHLQLAEAIALVNTLPNFRVVESAIVGVDYNTKRKSVWGTGQIKSLVKLKHQNRVSAVMVNIEILTPMQQDELFNIFRVPIFDRYNIVLSIFKYYAKSEEARLQIKLAEIPYIRHRLQYLNKSSSKASVLRIEDNEHKNVDQLEQLRVYEQNIRKKLQQVIAEGEKNMLNGKSGAVLIAVVGYTNAGKTSLVKLLTGDNSLQPEDRLFATLDTTVHHARLPSGRRIMLADTIGFLSELPIHLLAAFEATLGHVKQADIIIHLRDVSNPDWPAQNEDVVKKLQAMGIKTKTVITVDNKIDDSNAVQSDDQCPIRISCQTGSGIHHLISYLDKEVIEVTGSKMRRLKLLLSSPGIPYLYREGYVTKEPVPCESHLIFDIVMNDVEMSRFRKHALKLKKNVPITT